MIYYLSHYAHITGPSPYPFIIRVHVATLALSLLCWLQFGELLTFLLVLFLTLLLAMLWGKDVYIEGLAGAHNAHVRYGLYLAFLLFLFSEWIFFVSIFWVYLDAALVPSIWVGKIWPPYGIIAPVYYGLPLISTGLLLCRGLSLTWCHASLIANYRGRWGFTWTMLLGVSFLFMQVYEYYSLRFTIRDSIYGSIFYFSTGCHGLHVIVGLGFLLYSWYWVEAGAITPLVHVGFGCAVLYWHFVDVIWLLLYLLVYVWGR